MRPRHTDARFEGTPDEVAAINAHFRSEVEKFRFLWRCEDCEHVRPSDLVCSLEFPNWRMFLEVRALDERGVPVFCKYFEAM